MSADLRCVQLARELVHQPALARVEVRLPNGETRPIEGVVYAIKPCTHDIEPRRYVQIVVGPAAQAPRKTGLAARVQQLLGKVVRNGA